MASGVNEREFGELVGLMKAQADSATQLWVEVSGMRKDIQVLHSDLQVIGDRRKSTKFWVTSIVGVLVTVLGFYFWYIQQMHQKMDLLLQQSIHHEYRILLLEKQVQAHEPTRFLPNSPENIPTRWNPRHVDRRELLSRIMEDFRASLAGEPKSS